MSLVVKDNTSSPPPTESTAYHVHYHGSGDVGPGIQRGTGAMLGLCVGCQKIVLEGGTEKYSICSAQCARPTTIHWNCALNELYDNNLYELRYTCPTCRAPIILQRKRKLFAWCSFSLNPIVWILRAFYLLWTVVFWIFCCYVLVLLWKLFVWNTRCNLIGAFLRNGGAPNQVPLCGGPFQRAYVVPRYNGGTIVSHGFDLGHLHIAFGVFQVFSFLYYTGLFTLWLCRLTGSIGRRFGLRTNFLDYIQPVA